ncbi:hypothetical protein PsYK624_105160 [Phanerochaete sordida]|uniref:F-box domain-containing protein n=1 Tax=Phanerochaete sordida TaxID=48140 RepID=A0A9P3LHP1_9APHY|nr:hypothetical protein PsYK624_105160 [Phanerochaete sordida]
MHKALTLGDVVAEIFAYLERGSLAPLSRTCKTLSNPALDALWRAMASLDPLYMTLPAGVWTRAADGGLVAGITVPAPADWVRFSAYASRIRELLFVDSDAYLRPTLLQLVMRHSPFLPNPPLPRLHKLRMNRVCSDAEVALCLTLLVHPKLRTLDIVWPSPEIGAAMLSFMQLSCPDIQALFLGNAGGLLPIALRFTHLRTFQTNDPDTILDMRTLMTLARFPHLRDLTISGEFTSSSFTEITDDEVDAFFPSLAYLYFTNVTGVFALAHFLRAIKPGSLQELCLNYTLSQQPAKELRTLAESIALHKDLLGLALCSQEPTADGVMESSIAPLGTLRHLTQVNLTDVLSYASPSSAAFDLPLSWTEIQTMHIDCAAWHSQRPSAVPALALLEKLLAACPRLVDLHTALAVAEIPAALGRARERRAEPLRLTVVLPASRFTTVDPYDVAEYLSDICPDLEVACDEVGGTQFPNFRDRWLKVNGWIARINAVRAAERQRMES